MAEMHKGYAAALFELSADEETNEGFKVLSEIFDNNPEYVQLVSSPALPKKERLSLLKEALGNNFPENLTSFTMLMCEKGVLSEFSQCAKEYDKMYKEWQKASVAYVRSAVALTGDEKIRLKNSLEQATGRNVTLVCSVEKNLVGGVIVEMDGKVYDGSVRRRLEDIKKVINK